MVRMTARAAAHATGLPPKVVPWLPGSEQGPRVAEREAGTDREAATEALGDGHDVGADAAGQVGEPPSGAAHPGLDLVEPQQRTVLVGDGAGRGEVALGGYDDPGLSLDRLEQDRGGLVGHRGGERAASA